MIRKASQKIIVCGQFIEKYTYEKPFFWGFQNKTQNSRSPATSLERTDFSIIRARETLYRIIQSNIDDKQSYKNLFVTLTFKKNIVNIKEANYEFKKFIQRFSYYTNTKYKYITVIEFQKRGAVHFHTLFFNVPYIKDLHLKIAKIWGNGMTEIKPIYNIRNISAYVSKYIRKGFFDKRLSRNKAYFCSRNCVYPQEWRNKETIDNILSQNILRKSVSSYPSSKYGTITKTLYKLTK